MNIIKATSKGQITLPAKWRKLFDTNQYILKEKGGVLEIKPLNTKNLEKDDGWTTIFDAVRDNKGNGITTKELSKILKKIINE